MSLKLKYLKIPEHKVYQLHDVFTRIDEELAEIIRGLDMLIDLLYRGTVPGKMRLPSQPVYAQPVPQPTTAVSQIVSLPAKVDIITNSVIEVDETEYKRYRLTGDLTIINSDDDVYYTKRPDMPGFPLRGGVYLVISRSDDLSEIYFKAVTGTTKVYIQELRITGT